MAPATQLLILNEEHEQHHARPPHGSQVVGGVAPIDVPRVPHGGPTLAGQKGQSQAARQLARELSGVQPVDPQLRIESGVARRPAGAISAGAQLC